MGNTSSMSDSDGEPDIQDIVTMGAASSGSFAKTSSTDLGKLFDHSALRELSTKITPGTPKNIIHQYRKEILHWLENRYDREEVTESQFCELLTSQGADLDDCKEAFRIFDYDGEGVAEVDNMVESLRTVWGSSTVQGELNYTIRTLQSCNLTPSFLDVYCDRHDIGKHGQRLLNYMVRNRANMAVLPFSLLESYQSTHSVRLAALKYIFTKIREETSHKKSSSVDAADEAKAMTKCYSYIEVSSNQSDVGLLTNNDASKYWQSDGSARSHWIRLKMKHNIILKQLVISVASSDMSYMPQLITISVGKHQDKLKEIKQIHIPSSTTGDVTLLENAKAYHPFVQINIKHCHSDGCDVRIRGLRTLGYKARENFSISDATTIWYLQMLSSTTLSGIHTSPALRTTILEHSQQALEHMPPLSLSKASKERPKFLTPVVLDEMSRFLQAILTEAEDSEMAARGLQVVLMFALARGNISGIIAALQQLLDNAGTEIPAASCLTSMDNVYKSAILYHSTQLQMNVAGADGGMRDNSTGCANVVSSSPGDGYVTAKGNRKANLYFKSHTFVEITKLHIKVCKGSIGAKCGMVFVYTDEDQRLESTSFSDFDNWTVAQYNEYRSGEANLSPGVVQPVAYFTVDDNWDEVEVIVDEIVCGKNVLLKLFHPRQAFAEHVGILSVKFYGYKHREQTQNFLVSEHSGEDLIGKSFSHSLINKTLSHASNSSENDEPLPCSYVLVRTLQFVSALAWRQPVFRCFDYPLTIEYGNFSFDSFWKLYNGFPSNSDPMWTSCKILSLKLLLCILPTLENTGVKASDSVNRLFQYLSDVIDERVINCHKDLKAVAKDIIGSGATVFFPDEDARRRQLFDMIDTISNEKVSESMGMVFQSLCSFFGAVDPQGILSLPVLVPLDYNVEANVTVMEKLLSVSCSECTTLAEQGTTSALSESLLNLLCSLQNSVLSWCKLQLESGIRSHIDAAETLLTKYVDVAVFRAISVLTSLCKMEDVVKLEDTVWRMESTFIGRSIRQLVLSLSLFCKELEANALIKLMDHLFKIMKILCEISNRLPMLFWKYDSEKWSECQQSHVVLRHWELESSHNYENNQNMKQTFVCPGASSFVVEFDPRCETEAKYDYLEFTDAKGMKKKFDGKADTDRWPLTYTFSGGNLLQLLFHSDGSNNEWGYKFKITAKGYADMPLCWMFDMQLVCAKLLGTMASCCIHDHTQLVDYDTENNDLWTTIFRGGYVVGRLMRSLSGRHAACTIDCKANAFLLDMLSSKSKKASKLISDCKERSGRVGFGGDLVDAAVVSVFAALLWHTQSLREEIDKISTQSDDDDIVISDELISAYVSAEGIRNYLIEQRQRLKLAGAADNEDIPESEDPVHLCIKKAQFLLKFSGLSKVDIKLNNKLNKFSMKRQTRLSNDGSRLRTEEIIAHEKNPCFRLILGFIRDTSLTNEKVEQVLLQRQHRASATAFALNFAHDFLDLGESGNILQLPNILFLQEMLSSQARDVGHYADNLDGCGFDLESIVRKNYYQLVQKLISATEKTDRDDMPNSLVPLYDFVQACLVHILDNSWQLYDLAFLKEIDFPSLLLNIARSTVTIRDVAECDLNEETELTEYERYMKWLPEAKSNLDKWYEHNTPVSRKDKQMFIARFSDLLDVEICCDGCGITLPGRRYRCLQCPDLDLCSTCFISGIKPSQEEDEDQVVHKDDHEFVDMTYKCDGCHAFIVGTRVHCTECEDFDLCLGCERNKQFPSGHNATHATVNHPLVKLRNTNQAECIIQAYIHQHVWLLFTSFTLTLTSVLYSESDVLDTEYLLNASSLHQQCVDLIQDCLQQISCDSYVPNVGIAIQKQIAFAVHSQERIIGLVGSMIPDSMNMEKFSLLGGINSKEFLMLLLKMSKGQTTHDSRTSLMALAILGRLMLWSDPDVCSSSVCDADNMEMPSEADPAFVAVDFLFHFGMQCLTRSCHEWASCLVTILQRLSNNDKWRKTVMEYITKCVNKLRDEIDPLSIFALFVAAGFPEILTTGTKVLYNESGADNRRAIVVKHFPDNTKCLLADSKSRKRKTVKDQYIECVKEHINIVDSHHLKILLETAKSVSWLLKAGATLEPQSVWVLALTLKTLHSAYLNCDNSVLSGLCDVQLVQGLLYLAGIGTQFSRQWMVEELEVLALMLNATAESNLIESDAKADDVFKPEKKIDKAKDSVDKDLPEAIRQMDTKAKVCSELLHDHMGMPYSDILQLYEQGSGKEALVVEIYKNLIGTIITAPASDLCAWRSRFTEFGEKLTEDTDTEDDKAIDTGMLMIVPKVTTDKRAEAVVKEKAEPSQCLMQMFDMETKDELVKKQRYKSTQLLKQELDSHADVLTRPYLYKVNLALAIYYSRYVLTAVLADWPLEESVISGKLLGCSDDFQVACVLDLLHKTDSRKDFQHLVSKVLKLCSDEVLIPMAQAACNFMEESTLMAITKESPHNTGWNEYRDLEKVTIPGASYLMIKFDNHCNISPCEELTIATDSNLTQNSHVLGNESFQDFYLPGDTLYYSFRAHFPDDKSNTWGYKFTVTGGNMGRFDSGYEILQNLLSDPRTLCLLSIGEVWSCLVYLVCKKTGHHRLKTIELVLRILDGCWKQQCKDRVDLTLLRPLWVYFCEMNTENNDCNTGIVSHLKRSLTELFFVAESLATKWGMSREYLVAIQDYDAIKHMVKEGLISIAAVSVAIGYSNTATELLVVDEEKKKQLEKKQS